MHFPPATEPYMPSIPKLLVLLFPSALLQWQAPPDPEPFVPCQPDMSAGTAELQQLGLLDLLIAQHAQH